MIVEASHSAAIVPQLCYRDARAGSAFLQKAFGFVPGLLVPGDGDAVAHAELWLGSGCVMLASITEAGPWDFRVPSEIGGMNTGAAYLAVSELDQLYARATGAGATVVKELGATDYGSRDFSVRDPDDFLWHVGTYRPWADDSATATASALEPALCAGLRYDDAHAAIDWLCAAFGFTPHLVIPGAGNAIAHAELCLSDDLLMLGSSPDVRFATTTPDELGGAYTQTINVWIADPDAHHARALAAGAHILESLTTKPYGARGYVARDPQGYVWNFSSYRPLRPASDRIAAP